MTVSFTPTGTFSPLSATPACFYGPHASATVYITLGDDKTEKFLPDLTGLSVL